VKKMPVCKFCDGEGQAMIREYSKRTRAGYQQIKPMFIDCPKCNGTGKKIE
jgi:DnaJ-class molecular chaperone